MKSQQVDGVGPIPPEVDAETPATETIELPASQSSPADLLTCGQNAAGLLGLQCIGYRGESYDRIHKLIAN